MSISHAIFLSFHFGIIGLIMMTIASGSYSPVSFRHLGCLISVRFQVMIKPEAPEAYSFRLFPGTSGVLAESHDPLNTYNMEQEAL